MKQVNIIKPGATTDSHDDLFELQIHSTTTAEQALRELNLPGYMLRTETGEFLTGGSNLYRQLEDGAKIFAVLRMQVGAIA